MNRHAKRATSPLRLLALQLFFSAAKEEMKRSWAIYRADRSDRGALDRYTAATDRCDRLKNAIYQFRVARVESRRLVS